MCTVRNALPFLTESLRRLRRCEPVSVPVRASPRPCRVPVCCERGWYHLEHLECSHQPHIQGRGAQKRTQLYIRIFLSPNAGWLSLLALAPRKMCSASQPEPITVECPPEVPDADPEEEYERLPVYVERLGILDEAEAADGWIKFEEETAATAPVVTDSGGGDVEFGNFEGGFGGSDSFGAAPSPRLAASDVELIKSAMAALDIQPPPWIRKMQHLQAGARRGTAALSLTLPPSSSPSARRVLRRRCSERRPPSRLPAARRRLQRRLWARVEGPLCAPVQDTSRTCPRRDHRRRVGSPLCAPSARAAAARKPLARHARRRLPLRRRLRRRRKLRRRMRGTGRQRACGQPRRPARTAEKGTAPPPPPPPGRRLPLLLLGHVSPAPPPLPAQVTGRELAAERRREREVRRAAAAAAAR